MTEGDQLLSAIVPEADGLTAKPADDITPTPDDFTPEPLLSDQISTDKDSAQLAPHSDEMNSVTVVEEEGAAEDEVALPIVEETKTEAVMTASPTETKEEGLDESSDSVEVVDEGLSKDEEKADVEITPEDIEEPSPVVDVEEVNMVESAPEPDTLPPGGSEKSSVESGSDKESASEDGLLSSEQEAVTEEVVPAEGTEEEPKKRYSLMHLVCSLVLVGALFFLSFSENNEPDQVTTGLSTLLFVYLTTFAAADLEMIDPATVIPLLINLFNAVVCPCLLTFVLANPAFVPADEVGLMTPVLAWLLGIELWVQFDKLDWRKMTLGVGVALCGVAVYLNSSGSGDDEVVEAENIVD